MRHADVQAWLDRYIAAWRTNERAPIEALFTADVVYRYRPYGDAHTDRGIEAVIGGWLGDTRDEPDAWDAEYHPYVVEGSRAVATGWSRYRATGDDPERTYHNVFLLRFADDGRCAEFTELYMLEEDDR